MGIGEPTRVRGVDSQLLVAQPFHRVSCFFPRSLPGNVRCGTMMTFCFFFVVVVFFSLLSCGRGKAGRRERRREGVGPTGQENPSQLVLLTAEAEERCRLRREQDGMVRLLGAVR
jgi:hypothetical protein